MAIRIDISGTPFSGKTTVAAIILVALQKAFPDNTITVDELEGGLAGTMPRVAMLTYPTAGEILDEIAERTGPILIVDHNVVPDLTEMDRPVGQRTIHSGKPFEWGQTEGLAKVFGSEQSPPSDPA
jgi:hypothetical protein